MKLNNMILLDKIILNIENYVKYITKHLTDNIIFILTQIYVW